MSFAKGSRAWGVAMALCALMVVSASQRVLADSATYSLDSSEGGNGTGPFGTITINVPDSTHATISFSMNSGFNLFGLGFNLSSPGSLTSGTGPDGLPLIVPPNPPPSGTTSGWEPQSNPRMDGFGVFSFDYETQGANSLPNGTFTFVGSNLTLAEFQGFSQQPFNADLGPVVVGGHVREPANGNTFFAGGHFIPEPPSLVLSGLGLGGLGLAFGLRRRLK